MYEIIMNYVPLAWFFDIIFILLQQNYEL